MKAKEIDKIVEYIVRNCIDSQIELYDFIYKNIEAISKQVNIDEELIEEELLDRNSKDYIRLVDKLIKREHNLVKIKRIVPYYYLISENKVNMDIKKQYIKNIEKVLKNNTDSRKGFIYQEFVLKFLKVQGIKILDRRQTGDGGLDIVGYKNIELFSRNNIKINLYGQIKCYSEVVNTNEVKQLIKDKMYEIIIEKNSFNECKQAIFINHCGFSKSAREYAKKQDIILLDTDDIVTAIINSKMNKNNYLIYK